MRILFRACLCIIACLVCVFASIATANAQTAPRAEIVVSAASSLTDALTQIGAAFERKNPGVAVVFNFGASGALKEQIKQGAPVDVFAAAGVSEMIELANDSRLIPGTRSDFAGNRLALITPRKSNVKSWRDLAKDSVRRVAVSNPDTTPSGRYTRELLNKRGLADAVNKKSVRGETVRQTLTYVKNGDADAGIVFVTDAIAARKSVRLVEVATSGVDHAPIVYPAAVLKSTKNEAAARRFVRFLTTPEAKRILAKHGFRAAGR